VPETAASRLGKRLFDAQWKGRPLVLEGGGIEVNGHGTLLTTEECYGDTQTQVRNPGLGREDFEETLRRYLGATNICWLAGGVAGRRHARPRRRHLPFRECPDGGADKRGQTPRTSNFHPLAENWERIQDFRLEDGSKPEVVPLPMPGPLYFDGAACRPAMPISTSRMRLCLVPTFNDPTTDWRWAYSANSSRTAR